MKLKVITKTLLIFFLFVYVPFPSGAQTNEINQKSKEFIVIDLDGDGVELISLEESNVYFDIDGDGLAERTAWVHPDDGFLFVVSPDDMKVWTYPTMFANSLFTNIISKVIKFDHNRDRKYDTEDFVDTHIRKNGRALGFYIIKDSALKGILDRSYSNLVPCVMDEFSFENVLNPTIFCRTSGSYDLKSVKFEYEDTNVMWESMCDLLKQDSLHRENSRIEHTEHCKPMNSSN